MTRFSGGYRAVHLWMNKHYPRIGRCEYCGQWRTTQYAQGRPGHLTRNRAEWFEFCVPCHLRFDGAPAKSAATRTGKPRQPHSRATKKRIARAMKGKTPTEATRAKMAAAQRARRVREASLG